MMLSARLTVSTRQQRIPRRGNMSQRSAITNFDDGALTNPIALLPPPSPRRRVLPLIHCLWLAASRRRTPVFLRARPANGMTREVGEEVARETASNRVTDWPPQRYHRHQQQQQQRWTVRAEFLTRLFGRSVQAGCPTHAVYKEDIRWSVLLVSCKRTIRISIFSQWLCTCRETEVSKPRIVSYLALRTSLPAGVSSFISS